jgi:hypothetical protein
MAPTLVSAALIHLSLRTIGQVGADLRFAGVELLAKGELDQGFELYNMGSMILKAALDTAESSATAIELAGLGMAVGHLARGLPRLIMKLGPAIAQALKNPQILNAISKAPQLIKAAGPALRVLIDPQTYLEGLVALDELAQLHGWKIIGENANELVHFNSPKAFTYVDDVAKEIKIYLTAQSGSSVRLVELFDEVGHAVNAILGRPNFDDLASEIRNFRQLLADGILPLTQAEVATMETIIKVMEKVAGMP